jgi:hypothetical protein
MDDNFIKNLRNLTKEERFVWQLPEHMVGAQNHSCPRYKGIAEDIPRVSKSASKMHR